jgi:hypothetical protein
MLLAVYTNLIVIGRLAGYLSLNKKIPPSYIKLSGILMTPSAGIEPTSQEPESYVLSVAPRGHISS